MWLPLYFSDKEGAGETLQYEGAGPIRDRWEARFLKQPGCPEFGAGTLAVPMGECSSVVYDVQARTHFWSGTWVTDATVAVLLTSLITVSGTGGQSWSEQITRKITERNDKL